MKTQNLKRSPEDNDLLERAFSKTILEKVKIFRNLDETKILSEEDITSRQEYYAKPEWRKLSAQIRKEEPFCELCHFAPADQVHHLIKFFDQPDEERRLTALLDRENCISLCTSCHQKLHTNKLLPAQKLIISRKKNEFIEKTYKAGIILHWTNDKN